MDKKRITHALRAQLIWIAIAHLKEARGLLTKCACTKRNADRFAGAEAA
jgi:hypothetical protein